MSPTRIAMGPGEEFDRIRAIAAELGLVAGELGDDCATIPEGPGRLVASTDASIEGVHFQRDWITDEEIGWRAAARALSDLAPVAATPVGLLAALAVPPGAGSTAGRIMRGVARLLEQTGGQVLGGDLAAAPAITLVITVLGRTDWPLSRKGASAGDGLWVTGRLGGSRAAVQLWRGGHDVAGPAREAFAHPMPRLEAGRWLAGAGATAAIDLSDGLAGDVRHLAAASGLGALVDLTLIPVHPAVPDAARGTSDTPEAFAARGGEDYELLVAMPPAFDAADAARFTGDVGLPLTRVGTLTDGAEVVFRHDGTTTALTGFDHFA